jgi:hypothetical protein
VNMAETIKVTQVDNTKAKKTSLETGEAFIGKDILELISVSMYVEPLTLYREYIQNAADSIDQAVENGVLPSMADGEIHIEVHQAERIVKIIDNGEGISRTRFLELMLSFGASIKRGTKARGFRGVGRFSGLGYCRKLIFRTKSAKETHVSEVIWDGQLLKRLLADNSSPLSISELVKQVAQFHEYRSDDIHDHFFEVELQSVVRLGNDILLNEMAVETYISQTCPVPYSPQFSLKGQLNKLLKKHDICQGYKLTLADDFNEARPVFRPYRDQFVLSENESDNITGIDYFEIDGVDGGISAIGWIFLQDYKGILPAANNIRGIRVRTGNIQIGEESLLTDSFPEPRFNSWSIGEIHVLEQKMSPNGRRDNFDNNQHWLTLQNQFAAHGKLIAKICRKNSSERNAIKSFRAEALRTEQAHNMLMTGSLSKSKARQIQMELDSSLLNLEKLGSTSQISDKYKKEVQSVVSRISSKVGRTRRQGLVENDIFKVIPEGKARTIKEVFALIYESSPNKVVAQSLIGKILEQYGVKYGA